MKYWAFISYSHHDRRWGKWLHRKMETYRIPKGISGQKFEAKTVPRRIAPIFRDQEEMPASADLDSAIQDALEESRYLVVVCSPHAAESRWVNEEILSFKRMGRSDRILCLIVDGEPNTSNEDGLGANECFCDALRHELDEDGQLSTHCVEPIAADVRPGRDSKKNAVLRLVSGIVGVGFDDLRRRELQRRHRRLLIMSLAGFALAVLMTVLAAAAWMANKEAARQKNLAQENERQARHQFGVAMLEKALALRKEHRHEAARMVAGRAVGFLSEKHRPFLKRDSTQWDEAVRTMHGPMVALPVWRTGYLLHHDIAEIKDVAFHPDGKIAATCASDGIRLWELGSGRHVRLIPPTDRAGLNGFMGMAFSPSGNTLAAAGEDSNIYLFEHETGDLRANLKGHTEPAWAIAFRPGAQELASGGADWTVRLWDLKTGKERQVFRGHNNIVTGLAFSLNGRNIYSASRDGTIRRWPVSGEETPEVFARTPESVEDIALFLEKNFMASAHAGGIVRVWDLKTRSVTAQFTRKEGVSANSVAFNRDGSQLLVGYSDGEMAIRDCASEKFIKKINQARGSISKVRVNPQGDRAVFVSFDKTVRVRDMVSGRVLTSSESEAFTMDAAVFSPDGSWIATGGYRRILIWDASTGKQIGRWGAHAYGVHDLDITAAGDLLVTCGGTDQLVHLWEMPSGQSVATFDAGSSCEAVAFTPSGRHVVISSRYDGLQLWELGTEERKKIATFPQGRSPKAIDVSPDGRFAVTGDFYGQVSLWAIPTGEMIHRFVGHSDSVSAVVFSPNGRQIATGGGSRGQDIAIRLWNAASGEQMAMFNEHGARVRSLAFHPNGWLLSSGHEDGRIRLWDIMRRRLITVIEGHHAAVQGLSFSADGNHLASTGDQTLRLWDLSSGIDQAVYRGTNRSEGGLVDDTMAIVEQFLGRSMSFGLDAANAGLAAFGSADGTVQVWNVATGKLEATLRGHNGNTLGLSFAPDGNTLATTGIDAKVRLWDLRSNREVWSLEPEKGIASELSFNPDGSAIAVGYSDAGMVQFLNPDTGAELLKLKNERIMVQSLAFSPNGKWIAVASGDAFNNRGSLAIHNAENGKRLYEWPADAGFVTSVAFNHDATCVAYGDSDGNILLRNLEHEGAIVSLVGHRGKVISLDFSHDGRWLASSDSLDVYFWDVDRQVMAGTMLTGQVDELVFVPNSEFLLTSRGDWGFLWRIPPFPIKIQSRLQDSGFEGTIWKPKMERNLYGFPDVHY